MHSLISYENKGRKRYSDNHPNCNYIAKRGLPNPKCRESGYVSRH